MQVVAVSTDSHHTHLAFVRTPRNEGGLGSVNIPLVADISKRISSDYGKPAILIPPCCFLLPSASINFIVN